MNDLPEALQNFIGSGNVAMGMLIAAFTTAWITAAGKSTEATRSPRAKDFLDLVAVCGKVAAALILVGVGAYFFWGGWTAALITGVTGLLIMAITTWVCVAKFKKDEAEGKLITPSS